MREVTADQVEEILAALGMAAGQGVIVHSALQFLGRPSEGPLTYLKAFCRVLNIPVPSLGISHQENTATGTLAVPTFNFSFARGLPYDPMNTPAEGMGIFSEFVLRLPEARRSRHPLQSLAAVGADVAWLSQLDTPGAFDDGSAFEYTLERDYDILLLGCDIQAVSLLHYSEQRAAVPYRYWKDFNGEIVMGDTVKRRTYRMFARDLEINPLLEIYAIQELLETRGQWRQAALNYGHLAMFKARHFVDAADDLLRPDPWVFVTNRPHEGQ
jgi:aminoglycoside 3-N-acetyltransferase